MLLDTKQTHKRHNARCPHGITVHSNFKKKQEKLAETETYRIKITLSSGHVIPRRSDEVDSCCQLWNIVGVRKFSLLVPIPWL